MCDCDKTKYTQHGTSQYIAGTKQAQEWSVWLGLIMLSANGSYTHIHQNICFFVLQKTKHRIEYYVFHRLCLVQTIYSIVTVIRGVRQQHKPTYTLALLFVVRNKCNPVRWEFRKMLRRAYNIYHVYLIGFSTLPSIENPPFCCPSLGQGWWGVGIFVFLGPRLVYIVVGTQQY